MFIPGPAFKAVEINPIAKDHELNGRPTFPQQDARIKHSIERLRKADVPGK